MGAMKRLLGWHQSNWPIPRPLQAFAGMVPWRPTAEELADRKRDAAEARAEREAIQAEARAAETPAPKPRPEIALPEIAADTPELGEELPIRASPGWYSYGRTFYRIGTGPFAHWGFPTPRPDPIPCKQLSWF